MKQTRTFLRQTLDERQLAILVGLCVAACREVLQLSNANAPTTLSTPTGETIPSHATTALGVEDAQKRKGIGTMAASRDTDLSGQQTNPAVGNDATTNASEPKLLLTVEEAAARLSVGRPKMWQLVMRGEVLSVKIGASRRVPVAALAEYVQRLSAEAAQSAQAAQSYQQSRHYQRNQQHQRDARDQSDESNAVEGRETYGKQQQRMA
jgi:excisionase family DNA binding protein